MAKPWAALLVFAASILAAGLFGALHNQLSYSVGPAYFTELKFDQFGIAAERRDRLGAALVGWRAGWWMGAGLALPVVILAWATARRGSTVLAGGVAALSTEVFASFLGSLAGLLFALSLTGGPLTGRVALGAAEDPGALRAALMHEGAYLGALAGLPFALYAVWRMVRFERQRERT